MTEGNEKTVQFHEMGLDDRLLKAIAKLGWSEPTPIQEKAIPLALDGKDILSRARTGSGKTAAYIIPILQQILHMKKSTDSTMIDQEVRALVLVPSRELSGQAQAMMEQLSSSCSRDVTCVDLSTAADPKLLKPLLAVKPDIVIGTPSRVLSNIQAGNLDISSSIRWLVMDEADLLFSFGYEDDLKKLVPHFPNTYQAFIMSATFGEDMETLKKLILHNPVTLNLDESQLPITDDLTQYHVLSDEEDDKYLLIYALLKLKLLRGKSLIFVNSITRCYRLKLFLEQFGIPTCVLNSELPVNSRCHVVEQFNEGLYDLIIATDESSLIESLTKRFIENKKGKSKKKPGKTAKRKKALAKEYGVSRGIDFQNVANVINFDFPATVKCYIHRVGRTARGDKKGTALSFVMAEELRYLKEVQKHLSGCSEDDSPPLKPYRFKMDEIEGFRYRCKDAIRAVTQNAIRESRVKEVRSQMLTSNKLRTYFEDNPNDLKVLRHDAVLRPLKVKRHMKNVPDYLIPPTLKGLYTGTEVRAKRQFDPPSHDMKIGGKRQKLGRPNPKYKKQQEDPLKSFKYVKK